MTHLLPICELCAGRVPVGHSIRVLNCCQMRRPTTPTHPYPLHPSTNSHPTTLHPLTHHWALIDRSGSCFLSLIWLMTTWIIPTVMVMIVCFKFVDWPSNDIRCCGHVRSSYYDVPSIWVCILPNKQDATFLEPKESHSKYSRTVVTLPFAFNIVIYVCACLSTYLVKLLQAVRIRNTIIYYLKREHFKT